MGNIECNDAIQPHGRNLFHFSPKERWMNDPNGLVYFQGEYHMFYQYHPDANVWGPMHWGHSVSEDLIHWEDLPIALSPDENGMIFSGSAVVDWTDTSGFFNGGSGLVAIFTHHSDILGETQSIAYSLDCGKTWIKYSNNPVIPNPGISDFRDPKVFWHIETSKWVMVLACKDRVRFYSSDNLIKWVYLSEFGFDQGSHSGVWECPDLFKLPVDNDNDNIKWILKVDIGNGAIAGGSGGQYFIGEFDGTNFINHNPPNTILWLDFGQDFYAAQSWSDIYGSDTRRIWIGWNNNWKYANLTPTSHWRGAMTFPREVKLKSISDVGTRLVQRPIREIQTIRKSHCQFTLEKPKLISNNLCLEIRGDALEINAEFMLNTAAEFGFVVRKGEKERTVVGYDTLTRKLFVDRTLSGNTNFSEDFGKRHEGDLHPIENKIRLNILIDRYCMEVFGNEGEIVITDQIFPEAESKGVHLFALSGSVELTTLQVYILE